MKVSPIDGATFDAVGFEPVIGPEPAEPPLPGLRLGRVTAAVPGRHVG